MAALRKGQFDVTGNLLGIERLPPQVPGFEANLKNVTTWAFRDMHLHGPLPDELVFYLKIDGRPFFGKCLYNVLPYHLVKNSCSDILKI